jgi:hypothetical protein
VVEEGRRDVEREGRMEGLETGSCACIDAIVPEEKRWIVNKILRL